MSEREESVGHTPGPWLRIDKADYAEIQAAFRPSSQAIALVGKPTDADLIAAAPDLLEALDMCRMIIKFHVKNAGACCSKDGMATVFSALDAYSAAVTAIAKARGEAS